MLDKLNKKQTREVKNEIIKDCMDIIDTNKIVIKKSNAEMSVSYDICAKSENASGLMTLFTVKHEYNPYLHSNYYVLCVKDVKFYSNINYGEGIDFSESYLLWNRCCVKYEEQQKTNILKRFNSMKNYTAHLRAEYVKTEEQK